MRSDETSIMENLPHYRDKYEAAKKINVYFIPAIDERTGEEVYFYAIASSGLHQQMMYCIGKGDIPHFAVVVEKGAGKPSAEVKDKIKAYYGFDHDKVFSCA
jgi:hypothetical protein